MHQSNPDVIHLAKLIGRTPGSVAYKLVNLASLDPDLKARGIKGASNASKLDAEIWHEFFDKRDELPYESEKLLAKLEGKKLEDEIDLRDIPQQEGKERERMVRVRVNQYLFRAAILSSYDFTCCITGIKNPALLIASHIIPWAKDEDNRLNPKNGLCLNALHDRAFDKHLITITPDFKLKVSNTLKAESNNRIIEENFLRYEGKEINMPQKFLPDERFLKLHRETFTQRNFRFLE